MVDERLSPDKPGAVLDQDPGRNQFPILSISAGMPDKIVCTLARN